MSEPQAGEVVTSGVEPFPAGPHGAEQHTGAEQRKVADVTGGTGNTGTNEPADEVALDATVTAAKAAEAAAEEAKAAWLKANAEKTGGVKDATEPPTPEPAPATAAASAKPPSQPIASSRGRPAGFAQGPAPAQKA